MIPPKVAPKRLARDPEKIRGGPHFVCCLFFKTSARRQYYIIYIYI